VSVSVWVGCRVRRFVGCWCCCRLDHHRRRARSEGRGRVRCCGRGGVVGCRVCLFGCGRGGLSMGGGCRLRVDLCREAPLCLWVWKRLVRESVDRLCLE
jgi:hypothetical protein